MIRSGDVGEHVAPDKITVAQWIDRWIALLERQSKEQTEQPAHEKKKRKRGLVNPRTLERYEELLRCHIKPMLGERPLQQLQASEIDALYVKLETTLSARTVHHVHTVFGACLKSAVRKAFISSNPVERAEAPSPGEHEGGIVLEEEQLRTLVKGFEGSVLYPIVAVAAFTGARRTEILGLRWADLDPNNKTLRIERAVEQTKKFGLALKEPKRARHKRIITIDDDLIALLTAEREKHLRIQAGISAAAQVDLSLVKLPEDALMFPNPPEAGESFSFAKLRNPDNTTKEFTRKARKLGFPGLWLHHVRATHETLLLDRGVPVHVVAARCGHDPAVLLRIYAKRTRKADTSASAAVADLARGILKN